MELGAPHGQKVVRVGPISTASEMGHLTLPINFLAQASFDPGSFALPLRHIGSAFRSQLSIWTQTTFDERCKVKVCAPNQLVIMWFPVVVYLRQTFHR